MYVINPYALLVICALFTTGCSGEATDTQGTSLQDNITGDSETPANGNMEQDSDQDGLADSEDNWPNDPTKPVLSTLWGQSGESWDKELNTAGIQSRLPFYGLAGYRDGSELPVPACTMDVTSFGAVPNDDIDDTAAFWTALNQARTTSSVSNPVVICIPAGVYELSKQLHLNQSGMVLRGAGMDKTILNYKQGMIAQTYPEFVGKVDFNWDNNKAIILGDNGLNWMDALFLNELNDESKLPKQGDIEIALPRALTTAEIQQLQQSGNRIRLMQSSHYSHNNTPIKDPVFTAGIYGGPEVKERVHHQVASGSFIDNNNEFSPGKYTSTGDIKWANGTETIYQQFVVSYQPGNLTMGLDRPMRFDMTIEDIIAKRPKLQLIDSNTEADTDIGVESMTLRFASTEWGSCTDALAGYSCTEPTARHSGYWAQGGIDILGDFSWVRDVRFSNSDNALNVVGDFNTAKRLVIESDRLTSEGVSSTPSPHDTKQYMRLAPTGHVGIGVHGIDNLVDDVVMKTNFVHSLSMSRSQGSVYSNIRAIQPAQATDSWGRETVKINLDHHRQIIHATLWTNIQLGGSYRMWNSTGSITEGFNAAAYNTYWNIDSSSPEIDYWPHNNKGAVEWGYHYINIIGTNIKEKPPAPQVRSIDELPYPYVHKNENPNPFPYHPDNAHLDSIEPAILWPQNLYYAQREAYFACKLGVKPVNCP